MSNDYRPLDMVVLLNTVLGVLNYNENQNQSEIESDFKIECRNNFKLILDNQQKIIERLGMLEHE